MKIKSLFFERGNFLFLIISGSLLFALSILTSSGPQASRQVEITPRSTDPALVIIVPQPNSPLLISLSTSSTVDAYEPKIQFQVSNVSRRLIRTYSIRHQDISAYSKSGGVILSMPNSIPYENLFQPGQSRLGEISGSIYSDPILKVKLSIDFVEFADGTTWGKDVHKSAEKLEGCRAGERAVSDALLPFLNTGGIQAVGEAFELDRLEIEAPPGVSSKWAEGFRLGKAVQRERIQRALKSGKPAEVESILRHPLDSYKKR